ncbi:DNA/RNA polymerase [Neocallimastix californiae]|uniref:DNA/RNA polymerase n=1 Tax=Neocallimastix californiae TaxID=1754190 RepID=A0A1Y2BWW9_9FUNG|nr:DNA/RNA polymerase [Neocallimastix californiae]|eukprot:ORY39243.1 DNA/RNA polymerase [Neocallimastix californiae]
MKSTSLWLIYCTFSIFQGILNLLLEEKLNKGIDVYLDDIHIYGETKEECLNNCAFTLAKFQEQNLFYKLEKCIFFPKKFEYLGFEISYSSIKPISNKIEKPKPCNKLSESPIK